MTLFAGIDLGTSGARCLIVDERGRRVAAGVHDWRYATDSDGFASLDARAALDAVHEAIAGALAGCDAGDIAGAGVTSQRTGVVLIDAEGNELIVSPNADGRGVYHGIEMDRAHGDLVYRVAGRLPALIYLPARLAWFRSRSPDVLSRATCALSLSDWLVWVLTGVARTEPTQAAEMLCFDVARGVWSDELCGALGVPRALLPEVAAPGAPAGVCGDGLLRGVPVVPAGADTQCAALGMGVIETGDAIVVAGTTMICERVLERYEPDPAGRAWTSPHAVPGAFVREAHCGEAGAAIDWFAALLGASAPELAGWAARAQPGAGGVAFFDPYPSVATDFALVRRGAIEFAAPLLALGRGREDVARALFEGVAFGARAGLDTLGETASLAAAGGVTRAEPFTAALAGASGAAVRVATEPHASALGAAIAAAATHHGGVREAAAAMADHGREVAPRDEHGYAAHYAAWRERAADYDARAIRVSGPG